MNNNSTTDYSNYLQKPVEISTLFSSTPIRGEIIDVNENSITVAPTISNSGTDSLKSNFDMENTYYFPNNAILSIKEM